MRKLRVKTAVPLHVRSEPGRQTVGEYLDNAADGVARLTGVIDLDNHGFARGGVKASQQIGVERIGSGCCDQLAKLAQDYDGTARSIVDDLDGWGVSMDEGAASTVRAASQIQAALEDMGGKLKKAFSKENIDFGAFSDACAAAGVSTETLNSIGSANLAALASNFNGNIDQMVWEKFLCNVTVSAPTAAFDVTVGELR